MQLHGPGGETGGQRQRQLLQRQPGYFPGFHPPASLAISNLGRDSYAISGSSIPGRTNRIEFLQDLGVTNWQTLGTATANPSGTFQFMDTNVSVQRFYRSVYP